MCRRLSGDFHDSGFTLVELLVVMIVTGILASIAIPMFLSQRAKAHDSSTKADVSNVGKEIATYFVDSTGALTLDFTTTPGSVVIADGVSYSATVNLTNGTARPTSGVSANLGDATGWCVALTDPNGAVQEYRYRALFGLEEGTC
jgi:prepilin-type N-terminal cleavage/methylation domain-containing protein